MKTNDDDADIGFLYYDMCGSSGWMILSRMWYLMDSTLKKVSFTNEGTGNCFFYILRARHWLTGDTPSATERLLKKFLKKVSLFFILLVSQHVF